MNCGTDEVSKFLSADWDWTGFSNIIVLYGTVSDKTLLRYCALRILYPTYGKVTRFPRNVPHALCTDHLL